MSLAETEIANVESITRGQSRFGLNPLQQFARAGLDLKIGDFRQLCDELGKRGLDVEDTGRQQSAAIADILFGWMTDKLEQDAGK